MKQYVKGRRTHIADGKGWGRDQGKDLRHVLRVERVQRWGEQFLCENLGDLHNRRVWIRVTICSTVHSTLSVCSGSTEIIPPTAEAISPTPVIHLQNGESPPRIQEEKLDQNQIPTASPQGSPGGNGCGYGGGNNPDMKSLTACIQQLETEMRNRHVGWPTGKKKQPIEQPSWQPLMSWEGQEEVTTLKGGGNYPPVVFLLMTMLKIRIPETQLQWIRQLRSCRYQTTKMIPPFAEGSLYDPKQDWH